jgi:DNA-binding Lrp family transcriptional regulator
MDELLKILKKNALETPEAIAKMLGTTADKVKAKIEDYERKGVIKAYHAIVNEDALELNRVTAVIEVKVTPEREGGFDRIASRISRFAEVQSVYLMSGAYDLLLFVGGGNLKDVALFVSEKLATIEGVLSTSTHFMLKTYKHHGVLMDKPHEDERLSVTP